MKVDINEIKNFNKMIPLYIKDHLTFKDGAYLCPKCNKPLTYIDGCDHVECDYCRDIKGYISLVMYCENKDFKTAYKEAKAEYSLFSISLEANNTKTYYELDKRTIGTTYYNHRSNLLELYNTNYQELPLIFCDDGIGGLLFSELYPICDKETMPNIVGIKHEAYIYNAMRVLMSKGVKNNHKIKLFLIFENEREANKIKKGLIAELNKHEFFNYIVVEDLINHDYEHTIMDHYKHNKDTFNHELKRIVSQFNARYKKPIREPKGSECDNLTTTTPKGAN